MMLLPHPQGELPNTYSLGACLWFTNMAILNLGYRSHSEKRQSKVEVPVWKRSFTKATKLAVCRDQLLF